MGNFIFFMLDVSSSVAWAEAVSFSAIWNQVNSVSAVQDSAKLQLESTQESKKRAARHWLPRLYLDARTYRTNDPATSFMGQLEQRSLLQSDFIPSTLNRPEAQTYTRAALGLDLPIYQGGIGVAQVKMMSSALEAKSEELEQVRIDQYAATGKAYASIASLNAGLNSLREIQGTIQRLQKSYQLGNKSNPVGYSGALGMKALGQRLEALLQQYSAQRIAFLSELREFGVAGMNWTPDAIPAVEFAEKYFTAKTNLDSHKLQSINYMAEMSEKSVSLEKGKFLPQLGLFAEGYGFNGDRDTATGYSAGVYLRWSIFNPSDYGSISEASLKAASMLKLADASRQEERAINAGLAANIDALRANIRILGETDKVLGEQAAVTEMLFKNGSINALQFVEVVSRRTDLAVQKLEADLGFLSLTAQNFIKTQADIAELLRK